MHSTCYHWQNNCLYLGIYLQPRAKGDKIVGWHAGKLKIALTSPPVDNKANEHLCKFLAKYFGIPQSQITIIRGISSRNKMLCIKNPRNNTENFPDNTI